MAGYTSSWQTLQPGADPSGGGERERSTWLTEDDDTWDGDDAPLGVTR